MDAGAIALFGFVGFLIFLPIYGYVWHLKGEKKINSGVDKRKLQNIMRNIVPVGEDYTMAYAYWFQLDTPKWGRSYTTTYWYYVIGFNDERIYVVPLQFEDGEIYYKEYGCIEKTFVGRVESDVQAAKIRLFDKKGQEIVHLQVEPKNNSSHGNGAIDLAQEEEAEAFKNFITKWTSDINNVINKNEQTPTNSSQKNMSQNTSALCADGEFMSVKETERCLLQQTTSYRRGTPIITATNEENDLFLIYYYPNTFYIVKVAYVNNKLSIMYDYRRKNPIFEEFQFKKTDNCVTAMLRFMNTQVTFIVQPKIDCRSYGYNTVLNQTPLYNQFVSYLDTYRENINSDAMLRRKENSYLDLLQSVRRISDTDKKTIFRMLDEGNSMEAIKKIQACTGLGLADCKKIADSPYMYL